MSLTIRGDNQLIELEPERSYSVRDGWRTVRRWRGTKEAVNLFVPTLLVDGTNIRIIPDEGPTAIIKDGLTTRKTVRPLLTPRKSKRLGAS